MKHPALIAALCLVASTSSAQATYQVSFNSEWSAATHPNSFPSNPHMSPLIGGTHNSSYSMWAPGETATPGMESMAETGSTLILESELTSPVRFGNTDTVIRSGGIGVSPGVVQTTFEISASHPLVSLVSMVAPSPDWFVGVQDLPLLENGEWVDTITIDLYAWDAGTDSGATYTSANDNTDPAEPITALVDGVFEVDNIVPRLGTFTFVCQAGCGSTSVATDSPTDLPTSVTLGQPWPNPATNHVVIPVEANTAIAVRIELIDALGRSFKKLSHSVPAAGQHQFRVDTAGLASGLWHVRISGPDGGISRSFLIRR